MYDDAFSYDTELHVTPCNMLHHGVLTSFQYDNEYIMQISVMLEAGLLF